MDFFHKNEDRWRGKAIAGKEKTSFDRNRFHQNVCLRSVAVDFSEKGLTDQKIKIVQLFRHYKGNLQPTPLTGAPSAPGVTCVVCFRLIERMVASYPDAWLCDNALLAPSDVNSTLHGSTYP